ncbi:MAG: hypothetical protein IJZ16_09270 [Clostridia bacterium]|nr:hypothetical protein [Clostridia bacterium]
MKYVMFPHCVRIENKIIKTYGIAVFQNKSLIRFIKDVSTDRKAVKQLVKDMNEYQIELVHIDDVLEDFICQL